MNKIADMFWLAAQAAGGLSLVWPITLTLVLLFAWALLWDISHKRLRLTRGLFYFLLPATAIPIILLVGSLFEEQPHLFLLPTLGFAFGVLLSVVAVVRLRPAWLSSISLSLCFLWYSLWCWFVAGMSVTGDWL